MSSALRYFRTFGRFGDRIHVNARLPETFGKAS
jgi:hypothetical protein